MEAMPMVAIIVAQAVTLTIRKVRALAMMLTFARFSSLPSLALARFPAFLTLSRFVSAGVVSAFGVSFMAAHIALVTADIPFVPANIALVPPGAVMPLRLSLMRARIPAPLMLRIMALHIAPLDMPPAPIAMRSRLCALSRMTAASVAALCRLAASLVIIICVG
jgi:hypothetical protein